MARAADGGGDLRREDRVVWLPWGARALPLAETRHSAPGAPSAECARSTCLAERVRAAAVDGTSLQLKLAPGGGRAPCALRHVRCAQCGTCC